MMAGYIPERKRYALTFEDHPGLEIVCKSASLGKMLSLAQQPLSLAQLTSEKQDEIFGFFVSRVITWNLQHPEVDNATDGGTCLACGLRKGELLPTEKIYLYCLDLEFVMPIVWSWMNAIIRVAGPKEKNTSNGTTNINTLIEQLGQMQSQETLPTPNLS